MRRPAYDENLIFIGSQHVLKFLNNGNQDFPSTPGAHLEFPDEEGGREGAVVVQIVYVFI